MSSPRYKDDIELLLECLLPSFPSVVTVSIQHPVPRNGLHTSCEWFKQVLRLLKNPYYKFNTLIWEDWLFNCQMSRFYNMSDFYYLAEHFHMLVPLLDAGNCDQCNLLI